MANIAILSTAHIHTRDFINDIVTGTDGRRIIGIWDDVTERGQHFATQACAPFVADLDALIANPSVDGFIICSENTRHLPLLKKTLPLGKPVFCEKPLVTSLEELQEVKQLLKNTSTPLFCGYFLPCTAEMRAVQALLQDDALGTVTRVNYVNAHHAAYGRWFDTPELAWFVDPELSGAGALMDVGTHGVHLLRSFFGPVSKVRAHIANHSGAYPQVEDYGVIELQFSSGILGRLEAAWTQTGGINGLHVIGSKGAIWSNGETYLHGVLGVEEATPIAPLAETPNRVERLVKVIRNEIEAEELRNDLEATLDAVSIIAAAYASTAPETGWIDVE